MHMSSVNGQICAASEFVVYIIYSQDIVIDNIIAILYECEICAV